MSDTWPKVIRDPVHNIIPFEDTPCDHLLLSLINTKEFQRLRRIKQLGVSQFVFPGADHSRFAHSIGVMHTARKFLDRLARTASLTDELRTIVLAAALLHDVGHGPFSHAFEKITGESHERRTLEIVSDESTEVHAALRNHAEDLPSRVRAFFDEDASREEVSSAVPPFLTKVVSSQLDADRFDYLLRDSYATGSRHGQFDVDWLLQHLRADVGRGRLVLGEKALFVAEAYVFARYHMYRTVYFHKTTRAAEVMLRLLFDRYRKLLSELKPASRKRVVADAPPAVVAVFSPREEREEMALRDYLLLDDHSVTEFLKGCVSAKDSFIQKLGVGLLNRRLYKATDATNADRAAIGRFTAAALERIDALGHERSHSFLEDSPSDTPYKPYDPDADRPAEQIYIETSDGKVMELSTRSEPVDRLKKTYSLLRYYYPEEIRENVEKIARDIFGKETP